MKGPTVFHFQKTQGLVVLLTGLVLGGVFPAPDARAQSGGDGTESHCITGKNARLFNQCSYDVDVGFCVENPQQTKNFFDSSGAFTCPNGGISTLGPGKDGGNILHGRVHWWACSTKTRGTGKWRFVDGAGYRGYCVAPNSASRKETGAVANRNADDESRPSAVRAPSPVAGRPVENDCIVARDGGLSNRCNYDVKIGFCVEAPDHPSSEPYLCPTGGSGVIRARQADSRPLYGRVHWWACTTASRASWEFVDGVGYRGDCGPITVSGHDAAAPNRLPASAPSSVRAQPVTPEAMASATAPPVARASRSEASVTTLAARCTREGQAAADALGMESSARIVLEQATFTMQYPAQSLRVIHEAQVQEAASMGARSLAAKKAVLLRACLTKARYDLMAGT